MKIENYQNKRSKQEMVDLTYGDEDCAIDLTEYHPKEKDEPDGIVSNDESMIELCLIDDGSGDVACPGTVGDGKYIKLKKGITIATVFPGSPGHKDKAKLYDDRGSNGDNANYEFIRFC